MRLAPAFRAWLKRLPHPASPDAPCSFKQAMKLISSRETLTFLCQAAPRPWVQRMLLWMLFDDQLTGYFTTGRIQPHTTVMEFIADLVPKVGAMSGPAMDDAIRETYSAEMATKLIGKGLHDRVNDEPQIWDGSEGPVAIDPGYFVFATEIDWDAGTLWAEWIPDAGDRWEALFANDELLGSEFEKAEFEVHFGGLSFEFSKVEMLLPNAAISGAALLVGDRTSSKKSIGRPPKWDWEGALAFMISQAQTPDGLPTGAGAQARIEEMIAEWFVTANGDAPAPSQIRERAASIIRSIERPKTPKSA